MDRIVNKKYLERRARHIFKMMSALNIVPKEFKYLLVDAYRPDKQTGYKLVWMKPDSSAEYSHNLTHQRYTNKEFEAYLQGYQDALQLLYCDNVLPFDASKMEDNTNDKHL